MDIDGDTCAIRYSFLNFIDPFNFAFNLILFI